MTFCSDLRVLGSSVLKSWSRSTEVVVRSRPSVAPSSSLGAEFGPGASDDVAVGDARQRAGADRRGRALVQRRVGLVDLDRDLGQVVGRQLDVGDAADAAAADLHVVVLDQLAGALEDERVLVLAAAGQQQDRHDDGDGQRADGEPAREGHAVPALTRGEGEGTRTKRETGPCGVRCLAGDRPMIFF